MGLWQLVSRSSVPEHQKVLGARWVFAWKKTPDGRIAYVKARYTARGDHMVEGVDYTNTFSSTATLKSFRLALAMVNLDPSHFIEQWDVESAYINSKLDTVAYCVQPPGYVVPGEEGHVYSFHEALHGLKNAGRAWQQHLKGICERVGATVIPVDPACCLMRRGDGWLFMPTWVDDLFPVYNEAGKPLRDELLRELRKSAGYQRRRRDLLCVDVPRLSRQTTRCYQALSRVLYLRAPHSVRHVGLQGGEDPYGPLPTVKSGQGRNRR